MVIVGRAVWNSSISLFQVSFWLPDQLVQKAKVTAPLDAAAGFAADCAVGCVAACTGAAVDLAAGAVVEVGIAVEPPHAARPTLASPAAAPTMRLRREMLRDTNMVMRVLSCSRHGGVGASPRPRDP